MRRRIPRAVAGWSICPAGGAGDLVGRATATFVPAGVDGIVFRAVVALVSERFPKQEAEPLIFIKVFWIKN
jgi:hypothetical protein